METIGSRQARHRNTTGFDWLRMALAFGVLTLHSIAIARFDLAQELWQGPLRFVFAAILPMFFALSGYLVSASLERHTLPRFLALRVLRIVPALALETVLVAGVLGTFFTTLPLPDYLAHPEFRAYFLNIFGFIHYTLPGVFGGTLLNAQLWTIPSELYCYVALALASITGLYARPRLLLALTGIGLVLVAMLSSASAALDLTRPFSGRILVFAFLAGVLVWRFRDRLPIRPGWILVAGLISIVALNRPQWGALAVFPLAYLTVVLGVQHGRRPPWGDVSYGVYLYHFPLAHAIAELFHRQLAWPALWLGTVVASLAMAWLSSVLVEGPVQARRKALAGPWLDRLSDRFKRWRSSPAVIRPGSP